MTDRASPPVVRNRMRFAINVALDMAQACRGLWTCRDIVGVGQLVPMEEQLARERLHADGLRAEDLRELAIKRLGGHGVWATFGLSLRQLDALQAAMERDSDVATERLMRAMYLRRSCVLEGVAFDF